MGSPAGSSDGSAGVQGDRQRETGDAAEDARDGILDQQLPRQPSCSGAERRPYDELAMTRGRSRQLHVRDVGNRHDEQQRRRHEQRHDCRPHIRRGRFLRITHADLNRIAGAEQRHRDRTGIRRADGARRSFRGGLCESHTRLEPRQRAEYRACLAAARYVDRLWMYQGIHTCASALGNRKSRGITPTMV